MGSDVLSPEDREQITRAIRDAETRTSGEIYCVLARQSDDYFLAAAFMLAVGTLVASLVAALAVEMLWFGVRLPHFVLAQCAALGLGLVVIWCLPAMRIHLVPRRMRYRRAHENAARQFLAHNVHVTRERTGVLVFLSLAERYAEIVADEGINAVVPQETWNEMVAGLTAQARGDRIAQGFSEAVGKAGALLAAHFPAREPEPNELPDHLVVI